MRMNTTSLNTKFAMFFVALLGVAVFTSVALTNLAVLGLLLAAPFAWYEFYKTGQSIEADAKLFLGLVLALCAWDVLTNILAGQHLGASLMALLHDMRTFGFVVLLWAVFANPRVARVSFWAICAIVVTMASVNLFLTIEGRVLQGEYFTSGFLGMSHMSHMYGQALVGLVFVLAQISLVHLRLSWRVLLPVALLLASLFFASERRTGWALFVVGLGAWGLLNFKRFFVGKYQWGLLLAVVVVSTMVASSDLVYRRTLEAVVEFNQYLAMTTQDRAAAIFGSVSIRMQFAVTAWVTFLQNNWWTGIGSIGFPQAYEAAATSLQVTPKSWATYNWDNPHNEYLFMLATKGVFGLMLYLSVFGQACRVAWKKTDELQRVGLVMFVFLFMVSITTNSMMIDMEEGHFTMLILLIFLAPKNLNLLRVENV
jgi:O-antigen ligase